MWNVFKFFFVWFWLGLVAFLVGVYFLGAAHPELQHLSPKVRHVGPPDPLAVLVIVVPFMMAIPSYFIARPKRA